MINPETVEAAIRKEFGDGWGDGYHAWSEVPSSGSFTLNIDGCEHSVEVLENTTRYEFSDGYTDGYPEHHKQIVLHVEGTGLFFLKKGFYLSFDGTHWEDLVAVTPREQTVVVYEEV
jgi:hypothetical protein